MADEAEQTKPEQNPLPSPSAILDAVAKGQSAADVLKEFLGKGAVDVSYEQLGELKSPKTPSRER